MAEDKKDSIEFIDASEYRGGEEINFAQVIYRNLLGITQARAHNDKTTYIELVDNLLILATPRIEDTENYKKEVKQLHKVWQEERREKIDRGYSEDSEEVLSIDFKHYRGLQKKLMVYLSASMDFETMA